MESVSNGQMAIGASDEDMDEGEFGSLRQTASDMADYLHKHQYVAYAPAVHSYFCACGETVGDVPSKSVAI